jgi:hypothetical protein
LLDAQGAQVSAYAVRRRISGSFSRFAGALIMLLHHPVIPHVICCQLVTSPDNGRFVLDFSPALYGLFNSEAPP